VTSWRSVRLGGLALATALAACTSPTAPKPPLDITTDALPAATRGQPYAEAVHATGGDGAYTWEIAAGALPVGLTLTVDDLSVDHAIITGTPDDVGDATFTLQVRSGDGQTATQQFTVSVLAEPDPLAIHTRRLPPALQGGPYNVQLRANGGNGQAVTWHLVSGSLPAGLTLTGDGRIEGVPTDAGSASFAIEVRSGSISDRVDYELRIVVHDTDAFRITIFAVTDVPASIQPHVQAAVTRWEAAIVGNLPGVAIPQPFFGPGHCGGFGSSINGTSTNDVLIILNIMPIDGPGRVLGRAGPCGLRDDGLLPFAGIVTLDVDDLAPLAGTETLTDIITHEIGHVLGFGTLWTLLDLVSGAGTEDPRYTGSRAIAEWQALGGPGAVPLEAGGGAGTRESHWRESVFRTELMTGFAEPVGIDQPLSRVTIAAQADLGYTVDMNAADNFSLGSSFMAQRADAHGHDGPGYDLVYTGPVLVLRRDGRSSVVELR
jgi:hypothetical protein